MQFLNIENNHGECWVTNEGTIMLTLANSSSIQDVWLGTSSRLQVVFHSDPKTTYFYEGVSMGKMFSLVKSDSVGAFIAKEIIPNHAMTKHSY